MSHLTISAALFIVFYMSAYKFLSTETNSVDQQHRHWFQSKSMIFFYAAFGFVTVLKVWLSQSFFGHSSDMSLFSAWADIGRHHSVSEFYGALGEAYYVDYPPLYLYVLTGIGRLAKLLRIPFGTNAYIMLIKLIPILADTASALIVYRLAVTKTGRQKDACILSLLMLFNPAYWLNSVFWGQIDGLYTLLILWLVLSVFRKRYVQAVLAFGIGMLTKPQMIIFLPLLGFWWLFDVVLEWRANKTFRSLLNGLLGVLALAGVCFVVVLPMFGLDFGRFFNVYFQAAGQYPYASLNAANIFGAFGLNWADVTNTFLGISYQSWGFISIILISAAVGLGTYFAQDRKAVILLSGFTAMAIFMMAHTMHERYMFPLVILLMVAYIFTEDKRMLFSFGVATILCFVQCGVILLDNEGIINLLPQSFIALSWVQLVFFGYLLVIWFKMLLLDDIQKVEIKPPQIVCPEQEIKSPRLTKKDWILVSILTVVYGITAFANLGSRSVPQRGYYPNEVSEAVVLDFGETVDFHRINFHIGWMDRRDYDSEVARVLTVYCGDVATEKTEELAPGMMYFYGGTDFTVDSVFRWAGYFTEERGRYLYIAVDEGDFYINEIACYDPRGNLLIPVAVESSNETAKLLFDEQEKALYEATWFDGTYFDEVYHPRTAYEYLNGLHPYENTHPPLGKVFISLGMLLFGVNPFGWRFFGTLAGVLMVPVAYLLGKRIFKDTKWAFATAFLFTFDFMHLSQTRLATIDSFTTLFVMLMFLFMHTYLSRSFFDKGGVKHTLLPLFFSGLCFGIGAAVKWQGIYAGFGLCVLFFWQLYRRWKEYRAAKEGRLVGDSETILNTFWPNTIKTLAAAIIFFVIVPIGIYVLSYFPIVLSGGAEWSYIWENQESMLSYHSLLTETHPYGSPWWSWPLDMRPLYAYNPDWDFVPQTQAQGITTFGNPLVWWATIPSVCYLIYCGVKGKRNEGVFTILAGFGAMYLPWVMVSRQAFIYHFFPCVIFVVLAAVYAIRDFTKKHPKWKRLVLLYFVGVLALYILFYPVLTGIRIPAWYAESLTWFKTWVLG